MDLWFCVFFMVLENEEKLSKNFIEDQFRYHLFY